MEITNSDEDDYNKYHSIPPHEYPLFQNYQLVGDSQLVRFAELFLNSKRLYFQNSSGRVGYCISGQNAKQLSRHLEHKPWPVYQNVILLIGTNDISLNTDPSQWKESLKRIVTLFKQYNVKNLFMLTVPPVPKLWHTVQHWTLFVQYNEILKDLETKYRGFFSTLQLVDITSIFFVKSSLSTSFYCARLDLYVACPALQEEEDYDQHFMMSVKSRTRKVAEEVKDNSYLKQSISLFDTMNMRYKLMACFKGQTNDEDVSSINKNRFDLIEVTLNDVCNIKNNLLAINNEGYLYTLRHAFQKFLSHINQDRYVGKRESYVWSVRELADDAFVPSKMSRSELYGATSDDLETSGVLCRSLDASGQSEVSMTETPVGPSTACVRKPPSSPGAAANTLLINIKQEICLKKSPDSTLSSGMKRRGSKENVWIELRDKPDKDPATPHVTKARRGDHSPKNVFFNSNSRSISVRFDSNESTSRQAVIDTITPTQVALAQKRTLAAATVTSVPPPSDASPDSRVLTNYDDLNSRWTSKRSCERERTETVGLGNAETAHLVRENSKYPAGNVALRDDTTLSSDGKQQHSSKKIDYYNAQSTRNFEETDVLNIEYLTPEEKQDLENRLSRKAMKQKSRHDTFTRKSGGNSRYQKWIGGYDQAFMERTNTIQFYQYVQAVCKYQTNHDVRPLEERTFYMHVRNMKSSEVSDLESKFYSSMLGRYEFYKFIKYISLDYIVPKMFPNKFKKVMFTSLIDKNSNLEKYVPRNLDISVFETHFSRPTNYPRNKKLRVDLVHLNQKGFELMKHSLCEAISQTEQGGAEPLNQ